MTFQTLPQISQEHDYTKLPRIPAAPQNEQERWGRYINSVFFKNIFAKFAPVTEVLLVPNRYGIEQTVDFKPPSNLNW